MTGADRHEAAEQSLIELLTSEGLQRYRPAVVGGKGAVQLQHVLMLKKAAQRSRGELISRLAQNGVADPNDRDKLADLLGEHLRRSALRLKRFEATPARTNAEGWRTGLMGDGNELPDEISELSGQNDNPLPDHVGEAGEIWPAGMRIVNGHFAHSIRAQRMLREPNTYGYIHLAAEVERVTPMKHDSSSKRTLLRRLKVAAEELLRNENGVRRADVFDAFLIHPGAKEGRELIEKGGYDIHTAEFDVVVLVECADEAAALRIRHGKAFADLKGILDDAARFVHCIAAKNPKRIAEVDRSRPGVFLFNYFFAADVESKGAAGLDILLAVWEYTAGWWTAKANLTNSTPLQPVEGELSCYSLINHCRWDRGLDIFPHLALRPTLDSFVVANFTANDIVSMPILYHLA